MGKEHSYIFSSGKDVSLVDWGREITGREKIGYLDPLCIIKTIFFQEDHKLYGIALPLEYKVSLKHLSDILEISKRKSSSLRLADTYPYLQKPHSMTPFIAERDLDLVKKIVFSEISMQEDMGLSYLVDFSYPGRMDLSLQMKYWDAASILREKYPGIVKTGKVY